jgi:hypothetical protein
MDKKTLFIERVGFSFNINSKSLTEAVAKIDKESGSFIVKGVPATILDQKNYNGRIYSQNEMKRAIADCKSKGFFEQKMLTCSADDHPETSFVKPVNASHVVIDAYIKEQGGKKILFNDWLILNTENGKNLRALIQDGVAVGTSIRGLGVMNESTSEIEEYQYLGTDVVGQPSAGTYISSKEYNIEVVIESVNVNNFMSKNMSKLNEEVGAVDATPAPVDKDGKEQNLNANDAANKDDQEAEKLKLPDGSYQEADEADKDEDDKDKSDADKKDEEDKEKKEAKKSSKKEDESDDDKMAKLRAMKKDGDEEDKDSDKDDKKEESEDEEDDKDKDDKDKDDEDQVDLSKVENTRNKAKIFLSQEASKDLKEKSKDLDSARLIISELVESNEVLQQRLSATITKSISMVENLLKKDQERTSNFESQIKESKRKESKLTNALKSNLGVMEMLQDLYESSTKELRKLKEASSNIKYSSVIESKVIQSEKQINRGKDYGFKYYA